MSPIGIITIPLFFLVSVLLLLLVPAALYSIARVIWDRLVLKNTRHDGRRRTYSLFGRLAAIVSHPFTKTAIILETTLIGFMFLVSPPTSADETALTTALWGTFLVAVFGLTLYLSFVAYYVLWTAFEYFPTHALPCERFFQHQPTQFGLILRPFGADGSIYLKANQGNMPWSSFDTRPVERVFSSVARERSDLPTYSVVDPCTNVAPMGPTYLRTGGDWKGDVSRLIKKAQLIVMIFPPGQPFTENTRWELQRVYDFGKAPRCVVLFHPRAEDQGTETDAVVRFVMSRTDTMSCDAPVCSIPQDIQQIIAIECGTRPIIWRCKAALPALPPVDLYKRILERSVERLHSHS